jgi:hypothetical protein
MLNTVKEKVSVITWSWWLVTMPLWGGLALMGLVLGVIGIIAFICSLK